MLAHSKEFDAALNEAGWGRSECEAEYDAQWDAYRAAAETPARTIAGLAAKVEMMEVQCMRNGDEPNLQVWEWEALVADIRRLAWEAQS